MTRLAWGLPGERTYEAGVDRGVFYNAQGVGTAWNGLVSVKEAVDGGDISGYYMDGVRYLNTVGSEDFAGTIEAFGYPAEFSDYDGMRGIDAVLFVAQQPRKPFGLSYRSKIGNDTVGQDYKYKLHIVYNCLVAPSDKQYDTIGDQLSPITFSWDFSTTPVEMTGHKPTAHLVIDSSNAAFMALLEDQLYGTSSSSPGLIQPDEIASLLASLS